MIESRKPSAGGRPVGAMVSGDDLRIHRLLDREPRWCEMGEACVMHKHGGAPQRLHRLSADVLCGPCRRAVREPVEEVLRTNGHKPPLRRSHRLLSSQDLISQAIRFRMEEGRWPAYRDYQDPTRPVYLCGTKPLYRLYDRLEDLQLAAMRVMGRAA
jgi:hypothetical protein